MIPGGLPTLGRSSGCKQPLLPAPSPPIPAASPTQLWGRIGPAKKTAALCLGFLGFFWGGDVTRVFPRHRPSAAKDVAHCYRPGRSSEQESVPGGIFTSADADLG